MTMAKYQKEVDTLFANDFISEQTRSFIVSFISYHIPTEYYTDVRALFEWSQGFLTPTVLSVTPFKTPIK